MKFYLAVDSDGRKILETRKDHAAKIDSDFYQFYIDTSQTGIQTLFQEALDTEFQLRKKIEALQKTQPLSREEILHSNTPEAQAAAKQLMNPDAARKQALVDRNFEANEIEGFILERATISQVENIFACIASRFADLAMKERSDG